MQDQMDSAPEAASSFSLQDYAGILRRRRAIILQAFVIILVAGVLMTLFQAPVYQTSGRLLVEPQNFSINQVSTSDPLAPLFQVNSQYSIPTQIQLLQSGQMMGKVAAKVPGALPLITAGAQEGTTIIVITAEGENPDTAANTINELMDIYVREVADQSGKSLQSAIDLTNTELTKSNKLTREYENKILAFKRAKNVPELDRSRDQAMGRVNELRSSYETFQTDYRVLEATIAYTAKNLAAIKANPLKNGLDGLNLTEAQKALLDPSIRQIEERARPVPFCL